MDHRHMRDGIVLGAAVGFGFAAFESAGYAFTSMLTVKGLSLPNLIETEFVRGILAPVGHGLWTAIIGGVLFHQSRDNVIRYTKTVLGTYLWVSVLHGLWDSMRDLAVALTFVFTGRPWQYKLLAKGYIPKPTPDQVHLFTVISVGGLAVVSLLGIVTLLNRWREASSEHSAAPLASRPRARRAN
jgi:hypothetical protein